MPQQCSESGRCRGLSSPWGSSVLTLSFHSNQIFARGSAERKLFNSSQSAYRASRLPGRRVASRQQNGAVRGDSHPLLQRGPAHRGAGEDLPGDPQPAGAAVTRSVSRGGLWLWLQPQLLPLCLLRQGPGRCDSGSKGTSPLSPGFCLAESLPNASFIASSHI